MQPFCYVILNDIIDDCSITYIFFGHLAMGDVKRMNIKYIHTFFRFKLNIKNNVMGTMSASRSKLCFK